MFLQRVMRESGENKLPWRQDEISKESFEQAVQRIREHPYIVNGIDIKGYCLGKLTQFGDFLLSLYKKYKLNIFGLKNWAPPFLQSSKLAVLQFSGKRTFFCYFIFKIT
jgi:hypothetical protein